MSTRTFENILCVVFVAAVVLLLAMLAWHRRHLPAPTQLTITMTNGVPILTDRDKHFFSMGVLTLLMAQDEHNDVPRDSRIAQSWA